MAAAAGDVVSKANMVSYSSSCSHSHQKEPHMSGFSICVVAKGCKPRGFALKVKPLQAVLRSERSLLGSSEFHGNRVLLHQGNQGRSRRQNSIQSSIRAQAGIRLPNAQKWWEKGLQPNIKEVTSAHDLVDSLTNAGDKLVVLDFFSPGCGGCKALHPKICQLAGMNPNVQFLQVNYEEHKSMCYSLGVHVLPFFRFYRGAHGRLCSFSCTNATIKKFKDALAKHTPDRCSLGPTEGLEEKELLALAANKDLSFTYTPKPVEALPVPAQDLELTVQPQGESESAPDPTSAYLHNHLENFSRLGGKTMVTSGR